jgi:hypothetical protein
MRVLRALLVVELIGSTLNCVGQEVHAKFDAKSGFIFPADRAMKLAHPCSRPGPEDITSMWTPTRKQIAELEDGLAGEYIAQMKMIGNKADALAWSRQYAGYISHGSKIIYVNTFSTPDEASLPEDIKISEPWKAYPMFRCDDGVAWGVEYVVSTKTFRNFQIDGCLCFPGREQEREQ